MKTKTASAWTAGADLEGIFPWVRGHEGSGVVLGGLVASIAKDDHVVAPPIPKCRQCEVCHCDSKGADSR
jgi:Zn-dependent alcohol dehydrogenase